MRARCRTWWVFYYVKDEYLHKKNGSYLRYEAKAATSHLRMRPARWKTRHTRTMANEKRAVLAHINRFLRLFDQREGREREPASGCFVPSAYRSVL